MSDFSVKVNGVEELSDMLKQLKKRVDKSVKELLNVMASEGEQYAINNLGHIDTGETLASISGLRQGNQAIILAGGNAMWIEFGTGVAKNAGNLHPDVVSSPVDIYAHGSFGAGKGANPNGWWYKNDSLTFNQMKYKSYSVSGDANKADLYVHTMGIEANMFMYHTYEKLVDKLPDYAKESFRGIFNK